MLAANSLIISQRSQQRRCESPRNQIPTSEMASGKMADVGAIGNKIGATVFYEFGKLFI
jgi:hypothetical protein